MGAVKNAIERKQIKEKDFVIDIMSVSTLKSNCQHGRKKSKNTHEQESLQKTVKKEAEKKLLQTQPKGTKDIHEELTVTAAHPQNIFQADKNPAEVKVSTKPKVPSVAIASKHVNPAVISSPSDGAQVAKPENSMTANPAIRPLVSKAQNIITNMAKIQEKEEITEPSVKNSQGLEAKSLEANGDLSKVDSGLAKVDTTPIYHPPPNVFNHPTFVRPLLPRHPYLPPPAQIPPHPLMRPPYGPYGLRFGMRPSNWF